MTRDLPVVDPETLDSPTDSPTVAGVVLAAGASTRFGAANKLLATVDGVPLVRLATSTLLDAGLAPVVVVVGHEAPAVRDALRSLDVTVVENTEYAAGQASSVRIGVESLPADVEAVVVALGDMPSVSASAVRTLVDAYAAGAGTALAAGFEGERGNPVLFDRTHFDALTAISGDVGGRGILQRAADAAIVETGDPGVRHDVDTPDDLDE